MFHIFKLIENSTGTTTCTKVMQLKFSQDTITVLMSAQSLLIKYSNYSLNGVQPIVNRTTGFTLQHNGPKKTHTPDNLLN